MLRPPSSLLLGGGCNKVVISRCFIDLSITGFDGRQLGHIHGTPEEDNPFKELFFPAKAWLALTHSDTWGIGNRVRSLSQTLFLCFVPNKYSFSLEPLIKLYRHMSQFYTVRQLTDPPKRKPCLLSWLADWPAAVHGRPSGESPGKFSAPVSPTRIVFLYSSSEGKSRQLPGTWAAVKVKRAEQHEPTALPIFLNKRRRRESADRGSDNGQSKRGFYLDRPLCHTVTCAPVSRRYNPISYGAAGISSWQK